MQLSTSARRLTFSTAGTSSFRHECTRTFKARAEVGTEKRSVLTRPGCREAGTYWKYVLRLSDQLSPLSSSVGPDGWSMLKEEEDGLTGIDGGAELDDDLKVHVGPRATRIGT